MKNATPRNSARPPTHANSFTPMNCSQLMAGAGLRGGEATAGLGMTGGGGGADAVSGGRLTCTGLVGGIENGGGATGVGGGVAGAPTF